MNNCDGFEEIALADVSFRPISSGRLAPGHVSTKSNSVRPQNRSHADDERKSIEAWA